MVVGIQNAEGSTLMTLADMSVVTAEVKIDETDIVNLKMGQEADVQVGRAAGQGLQGPRDRGGRPGAVTLDRRRDLAVDHRH